nr:hypothetical protein [Proteocatella sp.]
RIQTLLKIQKLKLKLKRILKNNKKIFRKITEAGWIYFQPAFKLILREIKEDVWANLQEHA